MCLSTITSSVISHCVAARILTTETFNKMGEKFSYDIFTLIELVEARSCLWDKTTENYKNKIARKNAWREICTFLEPEFEGFDDKKKNDITTTVGNKWNNLRDTFMKSLKTKSGQAPKKKYLYSDQMQFLLKTLTPDETTSSIPTPTSDDCDNNQLRASTSTPAESKQPRTPVHSRKKKLNPVDAEILKVLKATDSREAEDDEDKSFLFSILPTIKRLHEDDKLQFRIEVMQLLSSYNKRKYTTAFSTSSTQSTDSYQEELYVISLEPGEIELSVVTDNNLLSQ